MRNRWIAPICIAGMVVVSALVYTRLPARVPTHWNINGVVDDTAPRLIGAFLTPVLAAGLIALLWALPRIDPFRERYAAWEPTRRLFVNVLTLFLSALHGLMLGTALGWNLPVTRVLPVGIGVLFMVLGNEMGRLQPNWFWGIRTPWTLSDPDVWRRTHRVGGRLFVLAGALVIVATLVLPAAWTGPVAVTCVMIAALLPMVYSYLIWRRSPHASV